MEPLIMAMRSKRKANNMSIRALGDQVGVSFSSLARMERGGGNPNPISAARIKHWLGWINDAQLIEALRARDGKGSMEQRLVRIEATTKRILELLQEVGEGRA